MFLSERGAPMTANGFLKLLSGLPRVSAWKASIRTCYTGFR